MADHVFKLEATSALGDYHETVGSVSIREVADKAFVSIAPSVNGNDALEKDVEKVFGAKWPQATQTTLSNDGTMKFLGLQSDMIFALFTHPGGLADTVIKNKINHSATFTDQSDAWVMLEVSGAGVLSALERICPLDLSLDRFPVASVARTIMEHLGTIILRQEEDSFLLFGAVSSADDLVHAVKLSALNTQ